MPSQRHLDRRQFLSASVTLGLTAAAVPSWAASVCGTNVPTGSGPFYPRGPIPASGDLVSLPGHTQRARGQILYLAGAIRDRACRPVANATVTIWQTDINGIYKHPNMAKDGKAQLDPNFGYFGRVTTNARGEYLFRTIVPRAYQAGTDLLRAAHIHVRIAHAKHETMSTQVYFAGQQDDQIRRNDGVFQSHPARARDQLIVERTPVSGELAKRDPDALRCRFDLQFAVSRQP